MDFTGKTVVITGANRGIGLGIAQYFCLNNANVLMGVRDPDSLELPTAMANHAAKLEIVKVDVTKSSDLNNMVERALSRFGRIDILVNNAGVDQPRALVDITEDHLDYIWDVNVKGLVMASKVVAVQMVKQQAGVIINMSSIAGKEGSLYHIGYVSSKHAVIGATRCMARELISDGIRVNAVCPGLIDTDMLQNFFKEYAKITGTSATVELNKMIAETPRGRMGEPSDVAELVGFLSSDRAKNIVGHAFSTDGGILQY